MVSYTEMETNLRIVVTITTMSTLLYLKPSILSVLRKS